MVVLLPEGVGQSFHTEPIGRVRKDEQRPLFCCEFHDSIDYTPPPHPFAGRARTEPKVFLYSLGRVLAIRDLRFPISPLHAIGHSDAVRFTSYPMNHTHAHPSSPRSRLNSVATIRSHRLSNSSAHAYPLRNRSSVCVVQLPYLRGLLRSSIIRTRSGSIPLLGFSSGWPLSVYSPLFVQTTYSFSGIFPMGSPPIGLHSTPPTPGLVRVSRSYSLKSFGYDPVFKRAVRLFGVPLLPCSLARFRTSFST